MRTATIIALLFACATTTAAAQALSNLSLRPGDVLRVTVLRHPELTGEFPIDADGTPIHPAYRGLRVAGVPWSEVETRMRELLSRYETRPEFVLDPLIQVAVGGEVRQPNLYALRPTTTIAQAVALAGGATERGRLDRVRLFRQGEEVRIDLSRPEVGLSRDVIHSGDQIVVERSSSIFREYIAPAGSVVAALAALVGIMLRN